MYSNPMSHAVRCGSSVPRAQQPGQEGALKESGTMDVVNSVIDEQENVKDDIYTDPNTGRRFKLNSLGQANKSSTPVIKDQYTKPVKGLVSFDPPVTAVYDLSNEEELKAFNKLQAYTFPIDGPHVTILSERDEFYQGKFIKLVKYSYVWYLMPEPK